MRNFIFEINPAALQFVYTIIISPERDMVLTLDLLSCMDRLISVYSTIQSEALQSSTEPIVPSDEDRRAFEDYLKELAK